MQLKRSLFFAVNHVKVIFNSFIITEIKVKGCCTCLKDSGASRGLCVTRLYLRGSTQPLCERMKFVYGTACGLRSVCPQLSMDAKDGKHELAFTYLELFINKCILVLVLDFIFM